MKSTLVALSVAACTALPATAYAAAIPPPPVAPAAPVVKTPPVPPVKLPIPPPVTSLAPPAAQEPGDLSTLIADLIKEITKAIKIKIATQLSELKDKLGK
ncbi:hypothetical protein Acor_23640 [Acrocarpospora corrugata]|uniref:Uncharacterized protein n=1 Tax=Acrocarpospora corrugata TaxID=35763 RepID=A0A5M3VZN1_9ACTN|nr:hypothetical protein [Acrocarpospora corrugata]GES00301.1 hypothetical protein Acor_23640 [Acrocarpospora corrugata]